MNTFQLKIQPFQIHQINKFNIQKGINEHVRVNISGLIDKETAQEIQSKQMIYKDMLVILKEESEERPLFRGIISELEITSTGEFYQIEVLGLSYSYLLEREEILLRTFQGKGQTYGDIAKEVINARKNRAMIFLCDEKKADGLVIQYKESDWAFLKRLASQIHSFLVADCFSNKPSVYFGLQSGKKTMEIEAKSCKVCDHIEGDVVCREYQIEAEIFAEIGDTFLCNNMHLQISGVEIKLINHEIRCFYSLRKAKAYKCRPYENKKLAGLSLFGEVKNVQNEKLQIDLEHDIGSETGFRWFDYATVYSSSNGAGWYCMPEEGDKICLYFPNEDPMHAYVMNAMYEAESNNRKNAEIKYFRTNRKQEICFAPEKITITNHKGMSVVLDDQKGVTIKSNKDIVIDASGMVSLNSGGSILAKGGDSVVLKQNSNMIAIRNGIREHGLRIERQ